MSTGDTTAALVRAKVAVILSDAGAAGKIEAKWDVPITNATATANQTVKGAMLGRGYTAAQIATWNLQQETSTELGALLVVEDVLTMQPGDTSAAIWQRRMDRITAQWLVRDGTGNIPVTSSGVAIDAVTHDDNWDADQERGPTDDVTRETPLVENAVGF